MGQESREMEHGWTLTPLGTGRWGRYPISTLTLSSSKLQDFYFLHFGVSGFALKKTTFSPNQKESAGTRKNLELGVLGPEFYVVPIELAV